MQQEQRHLRVGVGDVHAAAAHVGHRQMLVGSPLNRSARGNQLREKPPERDTRQLRENETSRGLRVR